MCCRDPPVPSQEWNNFTSSKYLSYVLAWSVYQKWNKILVIVYKYFLNVYIHKFKTNLCYLKFFQQYTGNNFLWELVSISGMVSHDSVDPSSLLKINNLFLFFFSKKKRNGSLPLANKNKFSLRFKGILRLHFDASRLVLSESLALLTILNKIHLFALFVKLSMYVMESSIILIVRRKNQFFEAGF